VFRSTIPIRVFGPVKRATWHESYLQSGCGDAHDDVRRGALCGANAPTPPPNSGTASISASTPSERNPVLADNGDARTSKVVGSDVYNEQ
jgi:hypothetical protein